MGARLKARWELLVVVGEMIVLRGVGGGGGPALLIHSVFPYLCPLARGSEFPDRAIIRLVHEKDSSNEIVINVEYN